MRTETVEYKIYKFNELSEKVQEKVIENFYEVNVHYDWWEYIKEETKALGATRFFFDIGGSSYLDLGIIESVFFAENIIKECGKESDLYKISKDYLDLLDSGEHEEDHARDFTKAVEEEYLSLLRREYEYLTSREAIIETIECNEYEFLENGSQY